MATLALQAAVVLGGFDTLYVFFASNYFPQYNRVAKYIDVQGTESPLQAWTTETVWPGKRSDEELLGAAEPSIENITTTVSTSEVTFEAVSEATPKDTSKATSQATFKATSQDTTKDTSEAISKATSQDTTKDTSQTASAPNSRSNIRSTRSTRTIETLTADNTVNTGRTERTESTKNAEPTEFTESTDEIQGKFTALPSDLPECNFPLLYLGSSLLKPPYDISTNVNIEKWESAVQQLKEVQRLIDVHKKSLLQQYGPEKLEGLLSGLDLLVEKPIRIGCFVLQHLQSELIELSTTQSTKSISQRRALLKELLRESELQILHAIQEISSQKPNSTLLSWARFAPELQSESCPGHQCFVLDLNFIEDFTRIIPEKLLDEVRQLKAVAQYDTWHITKQLFSWLYGLWTGILRKIRQNTYLLVAVIGFLAAALFLIWGYIWGFEAEDFDEDENPLPNPGPAAE
ncbi:hypothetical protein GQX73_g9527 [Xylaria multiplex]|uniref:Uncharacterized protein n=1 Tax=Xylaria multiplex TaxID=323545 RepID=A0A7C8MMW0_9PEZI|nr:hypothetical protein GQX73_g9527 [Xylaria multiplex]